METDLFDGEYFIQKIEWKNLRAKNPAEFPDFGGKYSPEARDLLEKEGPKYQYGTGCLSDGVLGAWLAMVCGVGPVLDQENSCCARGPKAEPCHCHSSTRMRSGRALSTRQLRT
jgi:hypothetical protein